MATEFGTQEALSYKEQHEQFLSNLQGSSFESIAFLLLVPPLSLLFHRVVAQILELKAKRRPTRKDKVQREEPLTPLRFLLDFVIVLTILISLTWTHLTPYLIVFLLAASLLLSLMCKVLYNTDIFVFNDESQYRALSGAKKPFITEYRSTLLISTFIAILAVDFPSIFPSICILLTAPVFPREFAKTETYGISLMDVGVGSFLLSHALTSKQARGSITIQPRLKIFIQNLKTVSPLLVIGFARLFTVKAAEYQEHVSEYGVHWNFFFTLAAVGLLLPVLDIPAKYNAAFGLLVAISYQFALSKLGVGDYIKHAPRTNLFSQNKEGIISCIGYIALYLFGSQLGSAILTPKKSIGQWRMFTVKLIVLNLVLWLLGSLCADYIEEPSRRMVNLSYMFYVMALNIQNIASSLAVALVTRPFENIHLTAINQNALAMFLLANVLTGLVNMSIKTIYTPDGEALAILSCYMLVICCVAVFLRQKKITLKFW